MSSSLIINSYTFLFSHQLAGSKSNARPSPACSPQCSQRAAKLDHHGPQDEGHLPYDEPVQYGRFEEMSDRRMLGASGGPRCRSELLDRRIGWFPKSLNLNETELNQFFEFE